MKRLTTEGACHFSNRSERALHLDLESGLFVDWWSSLEREPVCVVYRLNFQETLPSATPMWTLGLQPSMGRFYFMETDQEEVEKKTNGKTL